MNRGLEELRHWDMLFATHLGRLGEAHQNISTELPSAGDSSTLLGPDNQPLQLPNIQDAKHGN